MNASGAVVPPNLVKDRFVHFSTDNVDINENTLDGKGTFHATQVVAWQRGPPKAELLTDITISSSRKGTLHVPDVMNDIIPASSTGVTVPPLADQVEVQWFKRSNEECPSALKAQAADLVFTAIQQFQNPKCSWTTFNEKISTTNPEQTTVGYLPIIQAPAHELDTLNTVVQRVLHVAQALGQQHIVLTVDEALYLKLMELKWSISEYKGLLIPRLGGLHIAMNFRGILGRHMQESGLSELWVECDVLGVNVAQQVIAGKGYARVMRVHKLALQALWRLLLPRLYEYLDGLDLDLRAEISSVDPSLESEGIARLVDKFSSKKFHQLMKEFTDRLKDEDPTTEFWWQYMQMVSILLLFTRAQRDGVWDLHLHAFGRMLPYFFRYDHINYARWGTVYLSEMNRLPPEVSREFELGNFVVKESHRRFNQVDPDHSTEWLNATGKRSGGLVGITRIGSAMSRWTLSYNLRTVIASQTKAMLMMSDEEDEYSYNERTRGRMTRDSGEEDKLVKALQQHNVFAREAAPPTLENVVNKDLATSVIQESLLGAGQLGQTQLEIFVENRLCKAPGSEHHVDFKAPIHKNKAPTFASLYTVVEETKGKQNSIKVDRNILQRLITAYRAGRTVHLDKILQHELMPVPLSLSKTDGSLHTSNKSLLAKVLTCDVATPKTVTVIGTSCLVIDGQALMMSLGKPNDTAAFGEYADTFAKTVYKMGDAYDRIDVAFDRY